MAENVTLEVYDSEGMVVLADMRGHTYVLPPATAVAIANAMLHAAEACGVTIEVETTVKPVTEIQRNRLVIRAEHILNSGQKQKRNNRWIAMQIIDSTLADLQ